MPQLSDLIEKKKFVKKNYRPWNLSGEGTTDSEKESSKISNQLNVEVSAARPPIEEIKALVKDESVSILPSLTLSKEPDNNTGNKTDNIRVTTSEHPDTIRVTETPQQSNNEKTARQQLDNVSDNVSTNKTDIRYLTESIKKLVGIQKNLFVYILNVCSSRGSLDTGNILLSDLVYAASCSPGSAKTSLVRLIEKHLIVRHEGKACKGGHMVLGVTKEIQSSAIQAQQALFNPYKTSYPDNKTGNILGNSSSYSSSIYNNKNTTTSLPEDWKKINYEPLQHIGFTESQIRQLHDTGMTDPEIVQDSINRFAYSLEYSDKVKVYSDPLNVLMGVLRKGQKWNEPNYISPKDLALKQLLEEKRQQKEKYDLMVKEIFDIEFPIWKVKLTENEIKQIIPEEIRKANLPQAILAALRAYFNEKVLLPRLREEGIV